MLMVPVKLPTSGMETVYYAAVLRVDTEAGLYLSEFSEDQPPSVANATENPLNWSEEKGTLVDRNGEVPRWYSTNISLERGGAMKAATEYATVPRTEHVRHKLTDADIEAFMSSLRCPMISGIVANGEVPDKVDQLSLALDVLGVAHTKEQLVGLVWHLEFSRANFEVQIALVTLGKSSSNDSTEGNQSMH